jgi:DNA-binding transcriptional ArsR family regulator
MREFMAVTKALSDPSRVRLLLALRRRELCVCQITELFGFAPSTMSKHLSILHQAGLMPKLCAATAESEKATLQNAVTATDQQIDQLVYELYHLTPEEIALVEGA